MEDYIAHVRSDNQVQSNEEHLLGTSELAAQFASEFQCENWGATLGMLHDLGKYTSDFQEYIRISAGLIENAELTGKVDHSSAGAILAKKVFEIHKTDSVHFNESYNWYVKHPLRLKLIFDSLYAQKQRLNSFDLRSGTKHPMINQHPK